MAGSLAQQGLTGYAGAARQSQPLEEMTLRELRAYAFNIGGSSIMRIGRKANLIAAIRRFEEKLREAGRL